MDIHLDYEPGTYCWVMMENAPIRLKVESVSITVALDCSRKNITVGTKYYLSNGAIGGEYTEKAMCHTKDELKAKIFG